VNSCDSTSRLNLRYYLIILQFSDTLATVIEQEVMNMSEINSDFVVKYFFSWIEEQIDHLYIKMELCDNSLRNMLNIKQFIFNRLPDQPMNCIEYYFSCELLYEITECVQYLHELTPPIIHRDLKPENILITYNGNNGRFVKICDHGLALIQESTFDSHTQCVRISKYKAPEFGQNINYDKSSDIYSLGIIAQEIFDIDIFEYYI